MTAKPSKVPHLSSFHASHTSLIRERATLGLFLNQLCKELADQRCEVDADEVGDFAYFDIKLACDTDDIDICVHDGHVVVRMVRQD
jgi:hypothetical protein